MNFKTLLLQELERNQITDFTVNKNFNTKLSGILSNKSDELKRQFVNRVAQIIIQNRQSAPESHKLNSTAPFTALIKNAGHVTAFMGQSTVNQVEIVSRPFFPSISSCFKEKGFPTLEQADRVRSMGFFNGNFHPELISSYSSMCGPKDLSIWAPQFEVFKSAFTNADGTLNIPLLKSFSSIYHGRNIPPLEEIRQIRRWANDDVTLISCVHRLYYQSGLVTEEHFLQAKELFKIDEDHLDYSLMKSFASIFGARNSIKAGDVNRLKTWCSIGGEYNRKVLRSITGMQSGLGMPLRVEVENFISACCFNGVLNQDLMRHVASTQRCRGIPLVEDVRRHIERCTINGEYNVAVGREIRRLYDAKGLPREAFVYQECKNRLGLLEEEEEEILAVGLVIQESTDNTDSEGEDVSGSNRKRPGDEDPDISDPKRQKQ